MVVSPEEAEAEAESGRTWREREARGLGVVTRGVMDGILGLADLLISPLTGPVNYGIENMGGGSKFFTPMAGNIPDMLDLPRPETDGENIAYNIYQNLGPLPLTIWAGGVLRAYGTASTLPSRWQTLRQNLGQALQEAPAWQAAESLISGLGVGLAQNEELDPLVVMGIGLAIGMGIQPKGKGHVPDEPAGPLHGEGLDNPNGKRQTGIDGEEAGQPPVTKNKIGETAFLKDEDGVTDIPRYNRVEDIQVSPDGVKRIALSDEEDAGLRQFVEDNPHVAIEKLSDDFSRLKAKDIEVYDDLVERRQKYGRNAEGREIAAVVVRGDIDGVSFEGGNALLRSAEGQTTDRETMLWGVIAPENEKRVAKAKAKGVEAKLLPNSTMADAHGEIDLMQQTAEHFKDKGGTVGKDIGFVVGGRRICDYCKKNIPQMARKMGLNSVTVYEQASGNLWYLDMREAHPKVRRVLERKK